MNQHSSLSWWEKLLGKRPSYTEQHAVDKRREATVFLDSLLKKARMGQELSDNDLNQGGAMVGALYEYLCERNQTQDNRKFTEDDRALFYLEALKLCALHHPAHNGWPFVSDIRKLVLGALRRRLLDYSDGWVACCAIIPALLANEENFARMCYLELARDEYLANVAYTWVQEAIASHPAENDVAVMERFLASVKPPAIVTAKPTLSLAQQWALSASIYPSHIRDRRLTLRESSGAAANRLGLVDSWSVTNTATAIQKMRWLDEVGHRESLRRDLGSLANIPASRSYFVSTHRREFEQTHIVAWDYCRLIQVARSSYTAGYLHEKLAWDAVFRAARKLRSTYRSWNEMGDDYILGCQYFNQEDEENPHTRFVRWLQTSPNSVWKRLPWDIDPEALGPPVV